jgi:hypothetical protein
MVLVLLLCVLPPAVILIALRLAIPSSSIDVAPTRVVRRPATRVERRPERPDPPRPLDGAPYDIWRQLR